MQAFLPETNHAITGLSPTQQQELGAVMTHLSRTSRLARLLVFLLHRSTDGESDRVTEYDVATEVFGRDRATFVASDDAIARVEMHRLRRKLRDYYSGDAKNHRIHLSLPPGSYRPVFLEQQIPASRPTATDPSAVSLEPAPEPAVVDAQGPLPPLPPVLPVAQVFPAPRKPLRLGIALCLVFAALVLLPLAIRTGLHRPQARSSRAGPQQSAEAGPSVTPSNAVAVPFRMLAGYFGPPQTDRAGNVWQADQFHTGGWPMPRPSLFIARTSDPLIFNYGRAGGSGYDVPLKPGVYELHLYFLQRSETAQAEDSENPAVTTVAVNGQTVLPAFDIVSDAMGRNIADERVLRDISPASDGFLHLQLSPVIGTPSLSAFAILPGTPARQLPTRLITQDVPYTDRSGRVWHPDNYFLGGRHLTHDLPASLPTDGEWLSGERYGHFSYAIPVDPRDQFTLKLRFSELYHGPGTDAGQGQRIFRVLCNGNILLPNFDISSEAPKYHLVDKTFSHLLPTAQGKLNLTFEPIRDYATVSSIEVIDEGPAHR